MSVTEITEIAAVSDFQAWQRGLRDRRCQGERGTRFHEDHRDSQDAGFHERRDQSAGQRGSGRRSAALFRDVKDREDQKHLHRGSGSDAGERVIVIGALADSVEEVIDLEPDQIQPPPRIGTRIRTDFIKGMGKRDSEFIMILDIDRVFSAEELAAVRGAESIKSAA